MADLMQQSQELIREVNRQRQQQQGGERGQNSENEGTENNVEGDQSRGIVTRRVPHLGKEMDQMKRAMEKMKESIRRANHVDDLIHMTDSPFIVSITSHPLLPSSTCLPWIYMM